MCVATDPVAVVVHMHVEVLVHGGEGGAVFQLLRRQTPVHHVVVESVQQLDVDVTHQSVQDFLGRQCNHNVTRAMSPE